MTQHDQAPGRRRPARRTAVAGLALAAVAVSGGLALGAQLPQSTSSATGGLSTHGGATRNDGDQTRTVRQSVEGGTARNVILLIGDGMGDSEITSARNYQYGAGGELPGIDSLPMTGQYTTYSLTKDGKVDYVPDSAATGTAWATGTKTYDNAVGVDIRGDVQRNLLEIAKANGLRTGNVSTAEIQDATPAVQEAHVSARSCYGPVATSTTCPEAALENGGLGSITEQLLTTRPDVTLGGGATTFNETARAGEYEGETLLQQAEDRGYRLVDDAASLAAVGKAGQRTPLLGLFAPGNMPTRWVGPAATPTGATQPAVRCTPNPARPSTQPTLADMTSKAIQLLDTPASKGFFLQVEGASIDKQDHAANACGQIGEAIDLDDAVQAAMAFAKADGNTSVFVTADHGHTSQIVETGTNTPGLTSTLLTADGSPMTLSYGTAPAGGSQEHTGTQVRIAGYGPKAANVTGLTDQTDLFFTISSALGLVDDPEALSADAVVRVAPRTVDPDAGVVATGTKFLGDSSASAVLTRGKSTVDLGEATVSGGQVSVFLDAPRKAGTYTVTMTGAQSGVVRSATFTVR